MIPFKKYINEETFYSWAMANGEVRTDDPDEFEKFMDDLIDGVYIDV